MASAPPEYMVTDGYRKFENGTTRSPTAYSMKYNSGAFQEMSSGGGVMSVPQRTWSSVRRERESVRSAGTQVAQGLSVSRNNRNRIERDKLDRNISSLAEEQKDYPTYYPYQYEYEGNGSICQSLDQLTLSNFGDDLNFLQHLGPKFNTLGGICQPSVKSRNVQL